MASEPGAPDRGEQSEISHIGRYEVVVELGRGGMGMVVKARNPDLNKLVAIKVLNSAGLIDGTSIERFKIEAKAGSQFSHPNVVSIFDFGVTADGSPYMVMEYIAGESLQDKLTAEYKVSLDVVLKVFEQVAKGLQSIHKQSIVHRDIKASNIMLQNIEDELYAKLVDFGIAKVLTDGPLDPQKLTKTGSVFGSPPYMSPEQCQGKVVDARSDIYSLGCVMYECLSGVPPILGDNALQTIFGHVSIEPQPLEELKSDDKTVVAAAKMIHKCLEKDPALRYQSCAELIAEITSIKGQRDAKQYNSQENTTAPGAVHPSTVNRWKTNATPSDANDSVRILNKGQVTLGDKIINVTIQAGGPMPPPAQQNPAPQSSVQEPPAQERSPQDMRAPQSGAPRADAKVPSGMDRFPSERLTISPAESPPAAKVDDLRKITQSHLNLKQQSISDAGNSGTAVHSKMFPLLLALPLVAIVVLLAVFSYTGIFKNYLPVDDYAKAKMDFALGKAHWDTARQEFLSALDAASKGHDSVKAGQIRNYLGRISLGSTDGRALINFTAALTELKASKERNKDDYITAMVGLAEAHIQQSDFTSASESLKDAKGEAAKLTPSPEVLGDISLLEAKLALQDSKKLIDAANLYDKALQHYEKSTSASADKKTFAWLESAKLYTTLQMKDQATKHAEKAISIAPGIADEVDRTEMIRQAKDVVAANKAAPSAAAAQASKPEDQLKEQAETIRKLQDLGFAKVSADTAAAEAAAAQHKGNLGVELEAAKLDAAKAEAELARARAQQVREAAQSVIELTERQRQGWKTVTDSVKFNNQARPAGY